MPAIEVRVAGLRELERKLDGSFLVQPEVEEVLDRLQERVHRPRKTLGFRVNTLTDSRGKLTRTVTTTLRDTSDPLASAGRSPRFNPRVSGASWLRSMIGARWAGGSARGALGAMLPALMNKAAKKVEARFGS